MGIKKYRIVQHVLTLGLMLSIGQSVFGENKKPLSITNEIFIDSVWVATKVSFALQTVNNKQFAAYYDKNRMMTVASRKLSSTAGQKTTLPNKLHWDSHNYVAMGIDPHGYIHISGNMHVNPLAFFRSKKPYDISSMIELNTITGINEQKVTYPKFFNNREGDLLFSYRSGSCGNGNILVKRFLPANKKWEVYLKTPLFEGVEAHNDRAAYHHFVKNAKTQYILKWESMGKSHGKHAPNPIPDGPISPLKLVEFN